MSTKQEASTDATVNDNEKQPASAASTVVVISSNTPAENLITSLKGEGNASESSAAEAHDVDDASELTREQWRKIITSSAIFKAYKGQYQGGGLHINRAPCAAIALKRSETQDQEAEDGFPEFEIADDTYVETRESKTSLEREMTLKAFTESGIHAALSGGTPDIGLGLGGSVSHQTEYTSSTADQESTTVIHAFYNIPRVIVHLHPDSLALSKQCENFFSKYGQRNLTEPELEDMLSRFYNRFGAMLPRRVTLGGRLCTSQEVRKEDETKILDLKKNLQSELSATVKASGVGLDAGVSSRKGKAREDRRSKHEEYSRMTLETQGGNGLLASCIPDWTQSVASHRYWRPIQQDQPEDLLTFLAETSDHPAVHDQILTLARYAAQISPKRLMEVAVSAEYAIRSRKYSRVGNFVTSGEDSDILRFAVELNLSHPTAIFDLQIYQCSPSGSTLILIHHYTRGRLPQKLNFDIELLEDHAAIPKIDRLPEEVYLEFHITLEPYMFWGKEAKASLKDSDSYDTVVLTLPDIEVNSRKRWTLPFVRKDFRRIQDMFPETPPNQSQFLSYSNVIRTKVPTPSEDTKHVSRPRKWASGFVPKVSPSEETRGP